MPIYAAPDEDYIVNTQNITAWTSSSTATLTNTTLTPARNLTIKVTDANYSITAFTLTIVGTLRGVTQTEIFYLAGGLVQEGVKLFESITSVTGTVITGNGTDDTLDVGFGKLVYNGLSLPASGLTPLLDMSNCSDIYGMPLFEDAIEFYRADYPVTNGVNYWRNVVQRGNTLEILYDSPIEAGQSICIDWGKKHTLTMDSVTVPTSLKELLIEGAVGYGLRELGNLYINKITDGVSVGALWHNNGLMHLQQFKAGVKSRIPTGGTQSYSRS